jgi:hypothetical protein
VNGDENKFMPSKARIVKAVMYCYKNKGIPWELMIGIDWVSTPVFRVKSTLCRLLMTVKN